MSGAGADVAGDAPLEPSLARIVEQVRAAAAARRPLRIVGGDTKRFYGRRCEGEPLGVAAHAGIVDYQPTELVVTARAGTPLAGVIAALAEHDQILGFEPPMLGPSSTIGGVVAGGLSGPARPYRGSVRDFVLGLELVDGRGRVLRFGGQVMKNVAGYDLSRLAAGSLGTLGVITEVSLRVVPRPRHEATLRWPLPAGAARRRMLELAREPWPVTAMAHDGRELLVRVSGSREAVADAVRRLRPARTSEDDPWAALRDYRLTPLTPSGGSAVWRAAVPPAALDPDGDAALIHDWGGAQRWHAVRGDGAALRAHCVAQGGHATCFRGADGGEVFTEPAPALKGLMQRVKRAFDPDGVLNPGRMYAWM